MKKKVLIIGSYGSSNIGDEALLSVLKTQWGQDYELSGLSSGSMLPHLPFGFRSFFFTPWPRSLVRLAKTDALVFGGGGLFTDAESLKAVLLWAWHVLWAKIFRRKIYFIAQSVDPFQTSLGKWLSTWAFQQASYISVRDTLSLKLLEGLNLRQKIHLTQDLTFLIPPLVEGKKEKILAINLRPWKQSLSGVDLWLDKKEKEGFQVKLIAMENSDLKVLKSLGKQHRPLIQVKDFQELKQLLNPCSVAIGMRLHFLIAAAQESCEVAGLAYASKVEGILNSLEIPYQKPEEWDENSLDTLWQQARKAKQATLKPAPLPTL